MLEGCDDVLYELGRLRLGHSAVQQSRNAAQQSSCPAHLQNNRKQLLRYPAHYQAFLLFFLASLLPSFLPKASKQHQL